MEKDTDKKQKKHKPKSLSELGRLAGDPKIKKEDIDIADIPMEELELLAARKASLNFYIKPCQKILLAINLFFFFPMLVRLMSSPFGSMPFSGPVLICLFGAILLNILYFITFFSSLRLLTLPIDLQKALGVDLVEKVAIVSIFFSIILYTIYTYIGVIFKILS